MMAAKELAPGVNLRELLAGIVELPPADDRPVLAVTADSRRVKPGSLFLARPGASHDARDYVDQALQAGATSVVVEAPSVHVTHRHAVPLIGVPDLAAWMGTITDRFYGSPSRQMWVAGVTGTNGKTSVSHFIAQALQQAMFSGTPCGLIGTLGYGILGALRPALHTTPDVVSVHRILAELRGQGAHHVVMEASSHGLEQGRLAGVAFDTAVFTNLTRDHLDYHRDMAAYGAAKRRLFQVPGLSHAVVNLDDATSAQIVDGLGTGVELIGFSLQGKARQPNLVAEQLQLSPTGLLLDVAGSYGRARLTSPLLGRFNADNLMAALATLLSLGMPLKEAAARLQAVRSVVGRMERFAGDEGQPAVVVDYAHTPDALAQVLATLREHCGAELWCLFGCGGERDPGKRGAMGAAAEALADHVVLTDDNPRGEDGDAIIRDILRGMKAPGAAVVERRRMTAIGNAIATAGPEDVILVAGKGHEDYQEVAGKRLPFSDMEQVQKALRGGKA